MVVEVPLSQGFVAVVDDADAESVLGLRWYAKTRPPYTPYAIRNVPGSTQYLHTFLTGLAFVDHIDGDGLNNQRANLRPSDPFRNQANTGSRGGSSQYRGVFLDPRGRGRWVASVRLLGRKTHLGQFATEEQAARRVDRALRETYGDHARLNFPEDST